MTQAKKKQSPLITAVLALESGLGDLERIAQKISTSDLKSESELKLVHKLMVRFAECGQAVASEVAELSTHLNSARSRAERASEIVADRAKMLRDRKTEEQIKLEQFHNLSEKVRSLNLSLCELKPTNTESISLQERLHISAKLEDIREQLFPLIEESRNIQGEARKSKMKTLEKKADSLTQTLQSVRDKLVLIPAQISTNTYQ